jgi:hypothetical protein
MMVQHAGFYIFTASGTKVLGFTLLPPAADYPGIMRQEDDRESNSRRLLVVVALVAVSPRLPKVPIRGPQVKGDVSTGTIATGAGEL